MKKMTYYDRLHYFYVKYQYLFDIDCRYLIQLVLRLRNIELESPHSVGSKIRTKFMYGAEIG